MTSRHFLPLVIALCCGAAACGSKSAAGAVDYSVSAQKNYEKGLKELEDKDWIAASKYFGFIKSRFPYSKYAVLAELRLADAQFGAEQYLEAIDSYRLFIKFHPTHEMVENGYAAYRVGESYYRMLPDEWFLVPPAYEKDQGPVRDALREAADELDELPDDTGELDGARAQEAPDDEGRPTEAGLPIFHEDTDEVSWLRHHTEKPPPPPAFEPPPERPLFAPDPDPGQPVRRPRAAPVTQGAGGNGFWPWESTGPGSTTGSGVLPAYVEDDEEDEGRPPGTSMLRLAGIIAACLLVLVAVVIAFNLGRGKTPLGTTRDETGQSPSGSPSSSSPSATVAPITGVTAHDFDPQGTDGGENPDEVSRALDGDPSTYWQTSRYQQQFGPGGLKTGVGLVLDLQKSHDVSEVDLTTVGSPTGISVYVTDDAPQNLVGLQPAGATEITGTKGTVSFDQPVSGRRSTAFSLVCVVTTVHLPSCLVSSRSGSPAARAPNATLTAHSKAWREGAAAPRR